MISELALGYRHINRCFSNVHPSFCIGLQIIAKGTYLTFVGFSRGDTALVTLTRWDRTAERKNASAAGNTT